MGGSTVRVFIAIAVIGCADDPAGGSDASTGDSGGTSETTMSPSSSSSASGTSSSTEPDSESSSTGEGTTDASTGSDTTAGPESTGEVVACAPGEKPGAAGSTDGMATSVGVAINVRTPADYDPTIARPLIVVFAPAGADAALTEGFTALTPDALDAGYVIAYADHVSPMSLAIIEGIAPILDDILDTWCIDDSRVFYTGHSDGGSISEALLAIDGDAPRPRGAAPSAAGITGPTMASIGCPAAPAPIMVMHSSGDALFPIAEGFGFDAAQVWADCNGCAPDPAVDGACQRWSDCADDVPTIYCEGAGAHGQWPGLNSAIISFFEEASG